MEQLLNGLAKASSMALITTLLTSSPIRAQQETISFQINPEVTQKVVEKLNMSLNVFPVASKQVEIKIADSIHRRKTYLISGWSMDINTISGEFVKLPNKYRVAFDNIGNKYVKDELCIEKYADSREMSKEGELLQRVGTDEYYWILSSDEFADNIIRIQSEDELIKMVRKLGYTEYRDEYGMLRMKSKTCEIKLNERTYLELKKDPEYISKLDSDQQKLSSLIKQSLPHTKTLDKYLSLYNVQRTNISSADLKAWRTATENAQKLQDQIYAVTNKYDGNTSFTRLDKSNALNDFLDNLLTSKGVLRM